MFGFSYWVVPTFSSNCVIGTGGTYFNLSQEAGPSRPPPPLPPPSFHLFEEEEEEEEEEMARIPPKLLREIEDQIRASVAKAKKDLNNNSHLHHRLYRAIDEALVDDAFKYCKSLGVNTATFFRTLELYDRYYAHFDVETENTIRDLSEVQKMEFRTRILVQKPLRLLTCALLASKMHGNLDSRIVFLPNVKNVLMSAGTNFSLKAIEDSELRVFRELGYRTTWVSPHDLVEQLVSLSVLGLPKANFNHFYDTAMLYLKVSYLKNAYFCSIVEATFHDHWNMQLSSLDFKRLFELNLPLRAAVVVAAAGFHVCYQFEKKICRDMAILIGEIDDRIFKLGFRLFQLAHFQEIRFHSPPQPYLFLPNRLW